MNVNTYGFATDHKETVLAYASWPASKHIVLWELVCKLNQTCLAAEAACVTMINEPNIYDCGCT